MPYVTAIMCSTAARTGMRSAAPPASESTRSASGRRRCDASSLRLTGLALRALPRPDQEAGAVQECPAHLEDREARGAQMSGKRFLVPVVRPDRHPRSEEHTSELQSPYDLVCR